MGSLVLVVAVMFFSDVPGFRSQDSFVISYNISEAIPHGGVVADDAAQRGIAMATDTSEVTLLTEESLGALLAERRGLCVTKSKQCRREVVRWPFPGTVQLWLSDDQDGEKLILARSLNLSVKGLAIRCEEPLEPGTTVTVAVHEPEVSFQGEAVVKHCTQNDDGIYCVGLAFVFYK